MTFLCLVFKMMKIGVKAFYETHIPGEVQYSTCSTYEKMAFNTINYFFLFLDKTSILNLIFTIPGKKLINLQINIRILKISAC